VSTPFSDAAGPGAFPEDPRMARIRSRGQDPQHVMPDFEVAAPDPEAERNRAQLVRSADERIAALEAMIAEMRAATAYPVPHGRLADGSEAPDESHAYDHPGSYSHTLLLATGEAVGSPNLQSTHHHSRVLGREVPVTGFLVNAA
jgi:hypothetical protein